jgi:threonine dehydrogenase-like Zn-dependent dehydrogenase
MRESARPLFEITLTTICGTDLHIVRGEYRVRPGLVIGHEPVGVIEELGDGVTGYEIGDRVLMRRLMNLVQFGRFDPTPLLTHRSPLGEIIEAYRIFGDRLDGVLKVAIKSNL